MPPTAPRPRLADALAAAAVAAAALFTTWNTVRNGFVWDDRAAVLNNMDVHGGGSLAALLAHDFWGADLRAADSHKSFRPLTVLSFRLNFLLSGFEPGPYHAVNSLAHAACSVLVWLLAAQLLRQRPPSSPYDGLYNARNGRAGALFAGLLFAVHPVHCDAVASIVGRADLLCTMLSLAAFIVHMAAVQSPSARSSWLLFAASVALVAAACVCKELGFTAFGLLFLYDLLLAVGRRHCGELKSQHNWTQEHRLMLMGVLGATLAALRVAINGEHRQMKWNLLANSVAVQPDRSTRVLSYAHTHAWYLWKLVWPRWLCFDYGFDTIPVVASVSDTRNALTALAYLAVVAGTGLVSWQFRRSLANSQRPSVAFPMALAFGILPFIPAANIFFPVGTVVAERLLYLPSVGFCLLAALVLASVLDTASKYASAPSKGPNCRRRWLRVASNVVVACCVFVVVAGSFRSRARNVEWESESTLFEAALRVAPANVKVLSNTAKTLLQSDPARAVSFLRVANGLAPGHVETLINLGVAFANKENYLASMRYYLKGIDRDPKHPSPPGFLGGTMVNFWRSANPGYSKADYWGSPTITTAQELLDRSIYQLNSHYPSHYYHRGLLSFHAHEYADAIEYFGWTRTANAAIHERSMDPELAISEASVLNLVAACHVNMGDYARAVEQLEDGLARFPDELDMRYNMAVVLMRQDQWAQASEQLTAALAAATLASHAPKLLEQAGHLRGMGQLAAAQSFKRKATELQA